MTEEELLERYAAGERDFSRARLIVANLFDAELSFADLSDADLSYADLRRADLIGANLRGADLSGAKVEGASMSRDQYMAFYMQDVDMKDVKRMW